MAVILSKKKKNGFNLSLQGKQLTILVDIDKICIFKQKLKFWDIYIHYPGLNIFAILHDFSVKVDGNINKCDFSDI